MQSNIGSKAAGLTMSAPAAATLIRQVAQTSPVAAAELERLCNGVSEASGGMPIGRIRSGQLYSSTGITIVAANTIAVQTATSFAVGVNNANAALSGGRVMTFADTNMTTGGALRNSAFLATGFGVKMNIDTDAATVGAAFWDELAPQLEWILNYTSLSLQIGAQDVQRLGTVGDWPAGGTQLGFFATGTGAAGPPVEATRAQVTQGTQAFGPGSVFDYNLAIPAETTLRMDCKVERAATVPIGGVIPAGVVIRLKTTFYGFEITALQG
tara:strand:- start:202 stop:1008 length:807 start_codon:yes stop_codon:yes gene_type:complete